MGSICTTQRFWESSGTKTVKIIHPDGRVRVYYLPIRAGPLMSWYPNTFLCSLESMYADSYLYQIPDDEILKLGHVYFLMPISKLQELLSLQELVELALKANASLAQLKRTQADQSSFVISLAHQFRGWCSKIPILGHDSVARKYETAKEHKLENILASYSQVLFRRGEDKLTPPPLHPKATKAKPQDPGGSQGEKAPKRQREGNYVAHDSASKKAKVAKATKIMLSFGMTSEEAEVIEKKVFSGST
ncbi:hypothetical protein ACFE04_024243 [Oxalis oulophora]